MTVVIEYIILDNMSFNFLLFYLTARTLKRKTSYLRILLASFAGTIAAVGFSLISPSAPLALFIKIILAPLLCFAAGGYGNFKSFLRYNLFFLAYTFVLGGVIIAFFHLTDTAVTALATVNYGAQIPVGVYVSGFVAILLIGTYCTEYIKFKRNYVDKVFEADIILDKVYPATALIDTGNSLVFDGSPVCFIVGGALKKRLAPYFALCAMNNTIKRVTVDTVLGQGTKYAVKAIILIKGEPFDVLLSTAEADCTYYDLILHNGMLRTD